MIRYLMVSSLQHCTNRCCVPLFGLMMPHEFLMFFEAANPAHVSGVARNEASAFFAFLVAFYVMEDWDHHGVFLK